MSNYSNTVARIRVIVDAGATTREDEDEAVLALVQLRPADAWSAIEEIDSRTGDDWLMGVLLRRALETVPTEGGA